MSKPPPAPPPPREPGPLEKGGDRARSGHPSERTAADETAAAEAMKDVYYTTRFGALSSIRYLSKRRSFFDFLHAFSKAVAAILGGAAFFVLVGGKDVEMAKWAALAVAIVSALDVAFGFAERARKADRQDQRFAELAADLEALDPEDLDPKAVRNAAEKRLMIEKDDPTVLVALNIICHDEEAVAEGYGEEELHKMGWVQRQCAQILTMPWFKVEPLKPREQETASGT